MGLEQIAIKGLTLQLNTKGTLNNILKIPQNPNRGTPSKTALKICKITQGAQFKKIPDTKTISMQNVVFCKFIHILNVVNKTNI